MISVILDEAGTGSLRLVRTADSVARQSARAELLLAIANDNPVVPSLAARLGLRSCRADSRVAAINAAISASTADDVLLVTVPWLVGVRMVATCTDALANTSRPAIVVPGLELRTPDGLERHTVTCPPDVASLLANPFATPPVFAARRSTWQAFGCLDVNLGDFAWCEWWFGVLGSGCEIVVATDGCATLEADQRCWWPPAADDLDLAAYRAVLEKHRALFDPKMSDLVVRLEMAAGTLIRQHRAQLAIRDRELAELERLRAEIAHHRAYITHHGDPAIDWGDFRRLDPVSRDWGYDRGIPIDRRYIDDFLAASSSDIAGAVLEVQEDDFTRRFGGPRVTRSDVVDVDDSNPRATVVADLRAAVGLQEALFGCIILTQTLHVIDDATAVVRECFRLLEPGGVLLATLPSASRVCLEYGEDGDLWRVTPAGARALFESVFGPESVDTTTFGNVLSNVAFLHGLGCRELQDGEFDATDPYHPLVVGVRANKPKHRRSCLPRASETGLVLLYHRLDDRADVHDLCVPPPVFEEQLSWLARECHVMPLEELLAGARGGLPERAVSITFDDGYLDTLETALPVLQRLGVPATIFATSRWLQAPGEYWWDTLERALLLNDTPPSLTVVLNGTPMTFATGTPSERRSAHDRLHDRLVHATLDARDRAIAHLAQWSALAPETRRRPLLADELRRLAAAPGISIGAHTINHLALPDQTADVQGSEVLESLRALEGVVGRRVDLFAHPYGAIDRATADLVRQNCRWSAGCQAAMVGSSFDAAAFPRLEVKRWDVPTLVQNLTARGFRLPTSREAAGGRP